MLVILIIMILIIGILNFTQGSVNIAGKRPYADRVDFESYWKLEDGTEISGRKIYRYLESPGQTLVLTRKMPDQLYPDDHFHMNAKYISFRIYVNDELVGSSTDQWNGEPPESYFYHINLTEDMAGKEMRLEITSDFTDSSVLFCDAMICSTSSYVEHFTKKYGFRLILSFILALLGVAVIVMDLTQPRWEDKAADYLSLGVFAIFLGTWSTIESQVPMLLMGSGTIRYLQLDYFCLCMLSYFFYRFCVSTLSWRSRILDWTVMFGSMGCTLAAELLTSRHELSWHQVIPIIYTIFIINIFGICFSLYKTFRYHKKRKDIEKPLWLVIAGMSGFLISIILDGLRYIVPWIAVTDSSAFIRLGAIFLLLMMIHFSKVSAGRTRRLGQSEILEKMAYTDVLTGCANRAAYETYMDQLQAKAEEDPGNDFMVVSFDLNNLKQVNDRFGHETGDRHIRAAADILEKAFGSRGRFFRTGGDEFMALMTEPDLEACVLAAIKEMRDLEEAYNQKEDRPYPLHIACGYSRISETQGRSLREAARISDGRMYQNKKEIKQEAMANA